MKILFIHHSTGANLIKEGHLRTLLHNKIPVIEFWDHSYNLYPVFSRLLAKLTYHSGLSDSKGEITGKDYNINLSNNSPKEYAEIFSRSSTDKTLQAILEYDAIAFKNCYPTTKIESDNQLNEYKNYYISIKNSLKKYTSKTFILFTPPPLRNELTKPEYAMRAVELTNWLTSTEFSQGHTNVIIFNLFKILANEQGVLKKEYTRFLKWDSHPNRQANKDAASVLVNFLSTHLSS